MSISAKERESFQSPPPKKHVSEHPFIYAVTEGKPALLYGLEKDRELIRDALRSIHGPNVQKGLITIDNVNKLTLKYFDNANDINDDIQTGIKPLDSLLITHIKTMRHFSSTNSLPIDPEDRYTALITHACRSAITTSKRHGVEIHFVIDSLDESELIGKHKGAFTTQELQQLLILFKTDPANIAHITFSVRGEIIPTLGFMQHLDTIFSRPPLLAHRVEPIGGVDSPDSVDGPYVVAAASTTDSSTDEDSEHELAPRAIAF